MNRDHDETIKEQIKDILRMPHNKKPERFSIATQIRNEQLGLIMDLVKQDRERAVREARIDELNRLIKLHTRTYTQTITDNMGEVYLSDGHSYISKYEAQERLAQLSNPAQEKGKL